MHQTKVGQPAAVVDLQPREENNGDTLEDDEYNGEGADGDTRAIATLLVLVVEVDDEVRYEFKEMVDEGSETEEEGTVSQESAAMRLQCLSPVLYHYVKILKVIYLKETGKKHLCRD